MNCIISKDTVIGNKCTIKDCKTGVSVNVKEKTNLTNEDVNN